LVLLRVEPEREDVEPCGISKVVLDLAWIETDAYQEGITIPPLAVTDIDGLDSVLAK
jgi:hypothetical protein